MTSAEIKRRNDALAIVKDRLGNIYDKQRIGSDIFFKGKNGVFFLISEFPGEMAIVAEYAENKHEAETKMLEDGDLYYIDEMTLDEIVDAIIAEAEG